MVQPERWYSSAGTDYYLIFKKLKRRKICPDFAKKSKQKVQTDQISMLNDDKSVEVSCMQRINNQRENQFRWPINSVGQEDKRVYQRNSLILKIDEPLISGSRRRVMYKLTEDDYRDASDIPCLILKN